MNKLTVDFILPETELTATPIKAPASAVSPAVVDASLAKVKLGKCSCGADDYLLASEMVSDSAKGIPASRMYECVACGTYRLG